MPARSSSSVSRAARAKAAAARREKVAADAEAAAAAASAVSAATSTGRTPAIVSSPLGSRSVSPAPEIAHSSRAVTPSGSETKATSAQGPTNGVDESTAGPSIDDRDAVHVAGKQDGRGHFFYPTGVAEASSASADVLRIKVARHSACSHKMATDGTAKAGPSGTSAPRKRHGSGSSSSSISSLSAEEEEKEDGRTAGARSANVGSGRHVGGGQDCRCPGYRPPSDMHVEVKDALEGAAQGVEWGWGACRCGHPLSAHNFGGAKKGATLEGDGGAEEEHRRVGRVAVRLDELLEDQGKILDFGFEDDDISSLRQQMRLPGPGSSTPPHNGDVVGNRKRKSRSPTASSRLSSPELPATAQTSRAGTPAEFARRRKKLKAEAADDGSPAVADGDRPAPGFQGDARAVEPSRALAEDAEAATTLEAKEAARKDDHGLPDAPSDAKGDAASAQDAVDSAVDSAGAEAQAAAQDDLLALSGVGATILPKRERPAVIEERSGLIQFRTVTNDGKPESMIILTGLKNIFQRQLPKMPREYITRLVLDRNHMSMAIVKRGLQVVGGITYRPFNQRRFAEIVFCAITSTEQVKGYGSHLMNHLKDYVKRSSDVTHFLTYADNYAIGYFRKQGFTKEISLDRAVWVGYIKDYEGGTLMMCHMVPRVEYLGVQQLLASQKEMVLAKIRQYSRSHVVRPGMQLFIHRAQERRSTAAAAATATTAPSGVAHSTRRGGGTAAATTAGAGAETPPQQSQQQPPSKQPQHPGDPKANFLVDPSEVPGLRESGWTPEMDELSRRPKRGPHHSLMRNIIQELSGHPSAWPFAQPVNGDEVVDYYKVITSPMDLSTMESKLEDNQYRTLDDLLHDANLIFENCARYNGPTSNYTKQANILSKFLQRELPAWKQAAGIFEH